MTHLTLCNLSIIACKLVKISRYNRTGKGPLRRGSCCACANSPCISINLICKCSSLMAKFCYQSFFRATHTYIDMNSVTDSCNVTLLSSAGKASPWDRVSLSSWWANTGELDATRRVYSHPRFKQNLYNISLSIAMQQQWRELNSPSSLFSSRRASEGHQSLEMITAHNTPTVTAIPR